MVCLLQMWLARKQNACGRASRSVYTVVDGVVWMLQDHKAEGETEMITHLLMRLK